MKQEKNKFMLLVCVLLATILLTGCQDIQNLYTTTTTVTTTTSTTSTTISVPSTYAITLVATACTYFDRGNNGYNDSIAKVGYIQLGDAWRSYSAFLKFSLSSLPVEATINSAIFKYYVDSGDVVGFKISNLSSSWEETSSTISTDKPSTEATIASGSASYYGYNSVDITNGFNKWHNGSVTNNGFIMERTSGGVMQFEDQHSTNPPVIEVSYTY